MPRRRYFAASLAAVTLLAVACAGNSRSVSSPSPTTSSPSPTPTPTMATPSIDPAKVHANELGLVPVLMFHQLVAHPQSRYDQTPAQFLTELRQLAADNYVPITAA